MPALSRLIGATRPMFLTASVLPVLLGTAWGWRVAGRLDAVAVALAVVATVLVHAASNVYNDVSDELLGTDRANNAAIAPFTGGSRYIQDGLMSVQAMRRLAASLALLAVAIGTLLALRHGAAVVLFGVIGATLGAAYSMPGPRLSGRGLGEVSIAAAFGVLPVAGAAWLQAGRLDADAVLVALPVSAWIAAVITANEIPDAPADGATGKRTLAVRLGRRTVILYAAVQASAFAAIVALAATGLLPWWAATVPAALLAIAFGAARALAGSRAGLERGIRLTLVIHAAGCAWLIAVICAPAAMFRG